VVIISSNPHQGCSLDGYPVGPNQAGFVDQRIRNPNDISDSPLPYFDPLNQPPNEENEDLEDLGLGDVVNQYRAYDNQEDFNGGSTLN